jgi:hypothetical protein
MKRRSFNLKIIHLKKHYRLIWRLIEDEKAPSNQIKDRNPTEWISEQASYINFLHKLISFNNLLSSYDQIECNFYNW